MLKRYFLPLLVLVFVANIPGIDVAKSDNHIAKNVDSLSSLSRLINGIGIQWSFSVNSDQFTPIVSELLEISNHSVISEVLNFDVKKLERIQKNFTEAISSVVLKNTNVTEVLDDALWLRDVIKLENLENGMALLKSSEFKSFTDEYTQFYNSFSLKAFDPEAFSSALDSLKYLTKFPIGRGYRADEELTNLGTSYPQVKTFLEPLGNLTKELQKHLNYTFSDSGLNIFEDLGKAWGEVEYFYYVQNPQNIKTMFATLQEQAKELQKLTNIAGNSTIGSELQYIVSRFDRSLKEPQKLLDLEGIEKLFEDLKNEHKGLKTLMLGAYHRTKSVNFSQLTTGLNPLRDFLKSMKSLESFWKKIRDDESMKESLNRIGGILNMPEILNLEELEVMMSRNRECFQELKGKTAPNPRSIMFVIRNIKDFKSELEALNRILTETVTDPHYQNLVTIFGTPGNFAYSNQFSPAVNASEWLAQVTKGNDNFKLIPHIKESTKILETYTLKMLKTNFTRIQSPIYINLTQILVILSETKLTETLQCFRNFTFDYSAYEDFKTFLQDVESLKNVSSPLTVLKSFINATRNFAKAEKEVRKAVENMRKNEKTKKEERELMVLKVADLVAIGLAKGVKVVKKIGEVYENHEKILKIWNTTEEIDDWINGTGNWTETNKLAMKSLVSQVTDLNFKARSLQTPWKIFSEAQKVQGTRILTSDIKGSIFQLLNASTNSTISAFAKNFQDFPTDLQLDFSAHKQDLEEAEYVQGMLDQFFEEFFELKERTPQSNTDFYIGIGVISALFLISFAACGVMFYFNCKANDGEEN